MTDAHLFQRLQIYERRRTHTNAIRLRGAVGNYVTTDLALRAFDRVVVITCGWLHHFRQLRVDWTIRQLLQRLHDDAARLSHLFEPDEITIVRVAVFTEWNGDTYDRYLVQLEEMR